MTDNLNFLPADTRKLLIELGNSGITRNFYLSGGTALALYYGHRQSDDLDYFSKDDFDPALLMQKLEIFGKVSQILIDKGTLNCVINHVKLQFLHYPYPLIAPFKEIESTNISSIEDLACTKIITISSRGSKKDFIDIWEILKNITIAELFSLVEKKYKNLDFNQIHLLKSLSYFEDADSQPMPKMNSNSITWEEIKKEIMNKVKLYSI